MMYPRNAKKMTILGKKLIFFCILLLQCIFFVQGVMASADNTETIIAVFYGSEADKQLSEDLITTINRTAVYYNITETVSNSSFIFDNKSIVSLWWINELPLSIDLSFIGGVSAWKEAGKGLFIMNRFFEYTPIEILNQFGIRSYTPLLFPLNGSYIEQELVLSPGFFSEYNETELTTMFTGSSAWVELSNECEVLAEIINPFLLPELSNLTSGIWTSDSRVTITSFSTNHELESAGYGASISAISIIELLAQVAKITIGSLPNDNNALLQAVGINEIIAVGILSISGILTLILAFNYGLFTKLKDFFVGILMSGFFFIAHIAYSPQKRRISEDELLDNELREQIVGYLQIKGEQGAHLREIQREVGCGISSLLWHLQALDDFNLVTHEKIGKYHIFYLTGEKSTQTTELALALKSEVAKELCRLLLKESKPLSLSKISQEIDVHHSSVQHHIKKLGELGIIIVVKERKRSEYIVGPKHLEWLRDHLEVA